MNRNDVAAGVLIVVGSAALAVTNQCAPARASDTVPYVVSLTEPAIEAPVAWAAEAGTVGLCETGLRYPAPVGAAGERGSWQVHPIHFPRMRSLGLSPESPRDLARYAVQLWERQGWGPWSCKPSGPQKETPGAGRGLR